MKTSEKPVAGRGTHVAGKCSSAVSHSAPGAQRPATSDLRPAASRAPVDGSRPKNLVILGATGSIGRNALAVAAHLPDRLRVVGMAAGERIGPLARQARACGCRRVAVGDPRRAAALRAAMPRNSQILAGEEGLIEMVVAPDVDIVLCAIVGTAGLAPVLAAIRAGKDIALASKEVLVLAGELVMREAARAGVRILPVDSEHSALFQCLEGRRPEDVARLVLTASGGAFRSLSRREMERVTWADAMAHPTWSMGPKVTLDSATLMNKALEIVEAHWLFGLPGGQIDVLIHPESVIHSLVEFTDGTMLAQLSEPDMRFPIQYALTWPERCPGRAKALDLAKFAALRFERPDRRRFPALDFAYEALARGGTMPAVMNAANEVAVARFRAGEIRFPAIWRVIQATMAAHTPGSASRLPAVLAADAWAREFARSAGGNGSSRRPGGAETRGRGACGS
jgi:1-deoxy-D-xylulose-5-phosphate reductoisomerase